MQIEDKISNLITKQLTGELTFNQKLALDEWLKGDSANQQYFDQLQAIWHQARPESSTLGKGEDLIWLKLEQKLDVIDHPVPGHTDVFPIDNNKLFSLRTGIAIAASIFIVAFFLVTLKLLSSYPIDTLAAIDFAPSHANIIILTKPSAQIQLSSDSNNVFILPDNSRIWLNKNSRLSYDQRFGDSIRMVTLEGEGFFEVAPDANKPFVILANGSETMVLGTKFNLKAYQDGPPAVSVVSGKVTFSALQERNEKVILTKGEQATLYSQERKLVKQKWEDPHVLDWKHLLVYKREMSKPMNYLKNSASWKKSIINQTEIRGEISNLASLATYKNVKLRISYSRKNKKKTNLFTVYKSLSPGQKISYKYRLADWFGKTKDLKIEVVDASVTRNQ